MNAQLLKFAKKYYDFVHKTYPVLATYLGVHKFDHLLGDYSLAAIKKDLKQFKKFGQDLSRLDPRRLTRSDGIDFQLLENEIKLNQILLSGVKDWQRNPATYLETALIGVFLVFSRPGLKRARKIESIRKRLTRFEPLFAQAKANLKNPPLIFTQIALESLPGAINFVAQSLKEFDQKNEMTTEIQAGKMALEEFRRFLKEDLLPKSHGRFALGREIFEKKLKHEHFLPFKARQLYDFGQKNFLRVEKELQRLARRLNRQKSWQDQIEECRGAVIQGDLLSSYRREVKKLVRFLKEKDLMTFPEGEACRVEATPEFERPTVPYAAYMPPAPFEKNQTGLFWVTPIDESKDEATQAAQLKEHSQFHFMITALHEAYPGHHLQFAVANRQPSLIRKHGQSNLLCEGWALYCEQMMGEVGYYSDPRTKLFMLKDELWRAARIIIDAGLHCFNMSFGEAVEILVKKVKLAPAQAEAEVKRYTGSATQPMSYLVGKSLILSLREKMKRKWGKKFSLKGFHDELLNCGTIPVALVEKELL